MKKTKLASILVQGALLVAFAGGFYVFTQAQVKPQEVYVYSRDIPVNTVIQEGDLVKKHIPRDAVTNDMVTNKEDVVGKAVSTKSFPGQYVIKPQLVNPEDTDPFEQMDLSNYRKISIETESKDAVGGNLKRGDKVDLAFVKKSAGKTNSDEFTYSKIFMQDILVYNVVDDGERKYIDQTEGTSNIVDENGEVVESGKLETVILAVTPQQAEEIQARLKDGDIKLIGRFSESVDSSTPGYTIGDYKKVPTGNTNPEK